MRVYRTKHGVRRSCVCGACGASLSLPASAVARGRGRFCSPACSQASRRLPRPAPAPRPGPAERFWPKVDKAGPVPTHRPDLGPCWEWTGATAKGYGRFGLDGRREAPRVVQAHCWSYTVLVGPVPAGFDLDHLCRNRACVNPTHLEPVTRRVNLRRGAGRGGVVTTA